jgi:hypothetical protein
LVIKNKQWTILPYWYAAMIIKMIEIERDAAPWSRSRGATKGVLETLIG